MGDVQWFFCGGRVIVRDATMADPGKILRHDKYVMAMKGARRYANKRCRWPRPESTRTEWLCPDGRS